MSAVVSTLAVIGGLALEDHTVDHGNELIVLLFLDDDRRCRRRHGDHACRRRGGRHRRCRGRRPSMLVLVLVIIAVMVTRGRVHAGAAMIASASAAVIAIISSLR